MPAIPFRFGPKDVFVIDGRRWTPVTKLADGIALRPPGGGDPKPHSWDDLLLKWLNGLFAIDRDRDPNVCAALLEDIRKDLSVFTEEQRTEARRRLKYVRGVALGLQLRNMRRQVRYRPARTKRPSRISLKPEKLALVAQRIAAIVEPNGVTDAPSGTTLRNWFRRWDRCGRVYSALIPQDHRKGNRTPRVHEIAVAVMTEFAWKHYLTPEQPTAGGVFRLVRDEIRKRGKDAGMSAAEAETLVPDVQAFYRVIRGIDEYEKVKHRIGPGEADRLFRLKGKGPTYELPGEAVQIDHTKLPVVIQDPADGLKLKHITLTVAIDVATRAILGFYVGLEEGWPAIQQCLRMVMTPKDWLQGMEGIRNPWLCHCKPALVFTDQGADFRSRSLVDTCAQLVIRLLHTPAGAPDLKGVIERQFRRTKESIFAGMPGRLFKNGVRRIDYDPARNAVLTMEQVVWSVTKYIVDIYQVDWHDGLKDVPADAWAERAARYGVELAPSRDALIPLIAREVDRTVQHTGIEWMGLFYGAGSLELQALLNRHGPGGREYKVKIDPFDVGRAYVLHPDGHWITLECTDEAAKGRTMHAHLVACHHAQKKKKANEHLRGPDIDAAYREIMAPAEARNERRHTHRHAARKARVRQRPVESMASLETPETAAVAAVTHLGVRDSPAPTVVRPAPTQRLPTERRPRIARADARGPAPPVHPPAPTSTATPAVDEGGGRIPPSQTPVQEKPNDALSPSTTASSARQTRRPRPAATMEAASKKRFTYAEF